MGASDSISLLLTGDLNLTAYFTLDSLPTGTDTAVIRFSIVPNPAHGVTQIVSDIPVRQIVLYNVLGIKQKEEHYEPNGVTATLLLLEELPPGVYWLEATLKPGGKVIRRLVKS